MQRHRLCVSFIVFFMAFSSATTGTLIFDNPVTIINAFAEDQRAKQTYVTTAGKADTVVLDANCCTYCALNTLHLIPASSTLYARRVSFRRPPCCAHLSFTKYSFSSTVDAKNQTTIRPPLWSCNCGNLKTNSLFPSVSARPTA